MARRADKLWQVRATAHCRDYTADTRCFPSARFCRVVLLNTWLDKSVEDVAELGIKASSTLELLVDTDQLGSYDEMFSADEVARETVAETGFSGTMLSGLF